MKKLFARVGLLVTLYLGLSATSAIAGGDSYSIYLNNKLLVKEFVHNASLSLKDLQLSQANASDVLVINYSHCGTAGKGRSIAIKDDQGKTLKEWKFADTEDKEAGMRIPVKELLALEKQHPQQSLNVYYYSTRFLPKGRALAAIKGAAGNNTSYYKHAAEAAGIFAFISLSFTRFYI